MLLLIGIDGATPQLVERLTSTGRMPNLRALMRHGVYGRLESSPNCSPASAWASVLTGVNPGKHSVWGLQNLVPGSYRWRSAHARMLRAPTLSQMLTDRGLEVGTLFVPMTYPAREAEWTTVAGWLAPSVDVEGFAHPQRVASMAARRLQDVPLSIRMRDFVAAGRYEEGVQQAIEAMHAKCALAEELLADREWDCLAVNFTELDRVLRWCWHLLDRNHSGFREDLQSTHGALIADIHEEVDALVGRLIAGLKPSDSLLVISVCGTVLNGLADTCVPELMTHLDLVSARSSAGGAWHSLVSSLGQAFEDMVASLRGLLPGARAEGVADTAESEQPAARRAEGDPWIDYGRSWVIPAPGGHLFLNTQDEFPLGILGSGNIDSLVLQMTHALQTAIDPATGRRPLAWARLRGEVCEGPYVNRIPHIVTRWETARVVTGLTVTGRDGRVKVARPASGRQPSGAHGPEGIIIAAGGGMRRGVRIEGARVEDVAATAVHLCRRHVPTYFDGRVLAEALRPGFLADVPIRFLERELPRVIEDPARIDETSQVVEEHLRHLDEV